jgi:hypothetical protein
MRPKFRLNVPATLLILAVLGFHWPLLLSDSTLWDSVTIRNAIDDHRSDRMDRYFRDLGLPVVALIHDGIGSMPGFIHVYKLLSFTSLICASIAVYSLARQFKLAEMESFLIAAVSAAYPFFSEWHQPMDIPYIMAYAAFFMGLAVYFRELQPPRVLSLRFSSSLILLAISFSVMNSLYVYIYGVLFCVFLAVAKKPYVHSGWRFVTQNLLLVALPPIEFLALRLIFPRTGRWTSYNEIELDSGQIGKMMLVAPKRIVLDPLFDLAGFVLHSPAFFLLLFAYAVAALVLVGWALRRASTGRPSSKSLLLILVGSAVLFVSGVFPYAAVGKFPQINSYNDRHGILALLPVAIGIVMVLRYSLRGDRAFHIAGMAVLALCGAVQMRNYVLWQNRYVKYLAMIENLKGQEAHLNSVVVFDDHADFGERELLRAHEANWILKQAFQDERHIGFDAKLINKVTFTRAQQDWDRAYYMFSQASFGPTATRIDVLRDNALSEPRIFFGYYLASGEKRAEFLKSLLKLTFIDTETDSWLAK